MSVSFLCHKMLGYFGARQLLLLLFDLEKFSINSAKASRLQGEIDIFGITV